MWQLTSKLWHLCFKKPHVVLLLCHNGEDKEAKDIRSAIIHNHKTSKGYKTISKDLGIPVSTVHNVIKNFHKHRNVKNLPGCGDMRKIESKVGAGGGKSTTSNIWRPEASQERFGVMASTSLMRCTPNQTWLYGRRPRTTLFLKQKHKKEQQIFAPGQTSNPLGKCSVDRQNNNRACWQCTLTYLQMKLTRKRTPCQQLSLVEDLLRCVAASLRLVEDFVVVDYHILEQHVLPSVGRSARQRPKANRNGLKETRDSFEMGSS